MEIQANIPQMLDKTLWSYPSFPSESEFRHKVASRGTSVAPETTGTPDGGNRILKPGKVLGSPIWSKTLVDVGQHFHVVGYLTSLANGHISVQCCPTHLTSCALKHSQIPLPENSLGF